MRADFLALVEQHIRDHGHHITQVSGGVSPRFSYTIGLRARLGAEFLLAGGVFFSSAEIRRIVNTLAKTTTKPEPGQVVEVAGLGEFSFSPACREWAKKLMLGSFDYHRDEPFDALQIVPLGVARTLDVPDMSESYVPGTPSMWRWEFEAWPDAASKKAEAMTTLEVLRGRRVTEASRWEDDYWELLPAAVADSDKENGRLVSLAAMVGLDPSLAAALKLEVGTGLWRDDDDGGWTEMRASPPES
jgi:hypothetical protein